MKLPIVGSKFTKQKGTVLVYVFSLLFVFSVGHVDLNNVYYFNILSCKHGNEIAVPKTR
jgi:hypothetical protein